MNSNGLVKMGSRSIVYVGIYALIYQHTILGEGIVSRPAFWKSKNIVRALKFGFHFPEFSRFEHSFYKIFCIFAKTKDRNKIAKAKMTCLCRWVEIHHWCFSQTSSFLDWLSHGNSVEGRSFLKKSQMGPPPSLGFQINNRSFGTRL